MVLALILLVGYLLIKQSPQEILPQTLNTSVDTPKPSSGYRQIQPFPFSSGSYGPTQNSAGTKTLFKPLAVISCTPDTGFSKCYESTNSYSFSNAYAKVQGTDFQGVKKGDYYVGEVSVDVDLVGDKFYIVKGASDWATVWSKLACNRDGCTGEQTDKGKYILVNTGEEVNSQDKSVAFVSWDYDYQEQSDGTHAWTWTTVGWGFVGSGNLGIKSVACYDEADCSHNEYCDKSKDWKNWQCRAKECDTGQSQCVGKNNHICENYKFVDKGITKGQCNVECFTDNDCKNQNDVSGNVCLEGDVSKTISNGVCTLNLCTAKKVTEIVEECTLGCREGQCFEKTTTFKILLYSLGSIVLLIIFIIVYAVRKKK